MSHLYNTIEPNVISEGLLKQCVAEQGPQGELGKVANAEGIDFAEVVQLRLDFKNILRIENLWQFTNLRKLQLDNNIIEEIRGLERLTQLEWLDLSFNNIEVIGGLDALVNLKDLSLANNRIQTVENLDALTGSLQILSLANNLITDVKNVEYLRKFSRLQTLALKGNDLALQDDYTFAVIAYIPSLVFIDFRIIREDEKEKAREMFSDVLLELEFQESEDARRQAEEKAAQEQANLYKSAYVNDLQGSMLFKSMFVEDSDAHRIELLPGVSGKLKQLEENMVASCEHLTKVGLEEREKRNKELASYREATREACLKNQQLSVQKVQEYEELRDKLLATRKIDELKQVIEQFQHNLMWLEMQLVEQLDEVSKDFELNYGDMVGSFKESVQSHMTQLRDMENHHHEEVTELGVTTLERFAKGQLEGELVDDLRTLLVDKDTLVSALNQAHDVHLLAIDNVEDDISRRASKDLAQVLEGIQTSELARNRRKVAEIDQYVGRQKKELALQSSSGLSPYQ